MAYVDIVSTSEKSIRVQLAGCDPSYVGTNRSCSWYIDGVFKRKLSIGSKVSTAAAYTFTGLKPGTGYDIEAVIVTPTWTGSEYATAWTDEPTIIRPDDWEWTVAEQNAFANHGKCKTLSPRRWNVFIDKINEFVAYVNERDGTRIAPVAGGYYMGGDNKMYASSFNKIVEKIQEITGHSTPGITLPRRRGDPIKGVYFPYMSNILNSTN